MRNLKKLLAVVVVVAVMISVMAPAVFADTATTISADAQKCVDLGMIKGTTSSPVTTAYTASVPTRATAAMMLLRLKGLESAAVGYDGTASFSDVTVPYWKPILGYLKANPELGFEGVDSVANKFAPDDKIDAKQYYKVMLVALGYKYNTDFNWDNVMSFAAGKGLTKNLDATNFTVDKLAVATVETLMTNIKGSTTTTLAADLATKDPAFATKAIAAGLATAPAAAQLEVSSVTALNASQVKVVFSKAVNAINGAIPTNYSIKDANDVAVAVGQSALSTDYKEATLTLGATAPVALIAGANYTLKITKDLSLATATTLTTEISKTFTAVSDTSVPTVTSVETVGNKIIRVTFSKPVIMNGTAALNFAVKQSAGAFVKGQDYGTGALAAAYKANSAYKVIDVTVTNPMAVGDYTLQIYGNTDSTDFISEAQGYKMTTLQKAFSVAQATTVAQPTAVSVISRTEIRVTFDAPVTASGTVIWIGDNKTGSSATSVQVSDTTVKYTFATVTALPVADVEFTVPSIVDANGNSTLTKKFTVAVPASAVVTATAAQNLTSQKQIKVTYSVDMQDDTSAGGIRVAGNYSIVKPDGTTLAVSAVTADTTKSVILNVLLDQAAGTYTVNISNVKTALGDAAGSLTATATIADKTPVAAPTVTGTLNTAAHTVAFYIDFAENMNFTGVNSALNPANIFVKVTNSSGAYYAMDALPTGYTATISKVTEKRVKVTIAHAATDYVSIAADATDLKVQLIADASGNIIPNAIEVTTVPVVASNATIDQTTAAAIPADGVKVTGAKTIAIRVNGVAYDSVAVGDFSVYSVTAGQTFTTAAVSGQTPTGKTLIPLSSATVVNGIGYSTITLTTATDIPVSTKDIFVSTNSTAMQTQTTAGLKFVADRVFANGLPAGAVAKAKNAVAATLVAATVIDRSNVILEFTNEVSFISKDDFKFTVDGAAIAIVPANVYALDGTTSATSTTSRKIKLNFTGTPFNLDSVVTLKTVTSANIVSVDSNGTKLAEISTPTAVRNVPAVASVTLAKKLLDTVGGALSTGDTISIKFAEEIPATATVGTWIQSIKLVDGATDSIELYSGTNNTGDLVATIQLTGNAITAGGNNHKSDVTATQDATDLTKLVLTLAATNQTIVAADMNNVTGLVSILSFNTAGAQDTVQLVNKDLAYFNMSKTVSTSTQAVEAKTLTSTIGAGGTTVITSNYGFAPTVAGPTSIVSAASVAVGGITFAVAGQVGYAANDTLVLSATTAVNGTITFTAADAANLATAVSNEIITVTDVATGASTTVTVDIAATGGAVTTK